MNIEANNLQKRFNGLTEEQAVSMVEFYHEMFERLSAAAIEQDREKGWQELHEKYGKDLQTMMKFANKVATIHAQNTGDQIWIDRLEEPHWVDTYIDLAMAVLQHCVNDPFRSVKLGHFGGPEDDNEPEKSFPLWMAQFPDEFKEDPYFAQFQKLGDLARGVHTEIGSLKSQLDNLRVQLGEDGAPPENPDGYDLPEAGIDLEALGPLAQLVKGSIEAQDQIFRQICHDASLNQRQAAMLHEKFAFGRGSGTRKHLRNNSYKISRWPNANLIRFMPCDTRCGGGGNRELMNRSAGWKHPLRPIKQILRLRTVLSWRSLSSHSQMM